MALEHQHAPAAAGQQVRLLGTASLLPGLPQQRGRSGFLLATVVFPTERAALGSRLWRVYEMIRAIKMG